MESEAVVARVTEMGQVCGIAAACQELAVPRSWYYRQQGEPVVVAPVQNRPQPQPAHALSVEEKAAVETTLNSERFCDLSPRQVYAQLLDEGHYLCHWRTMYRILAGNVLEWVNDWYSFSYYESSPTDNPQGPSSGLTKGVRGGSWQDAERYQRSAWRNYIDRPEYRVSNVGFRCVVNP